MDVVTEYKSNTVITVNKGRQLLWRLGGCKPDRVMEGETGRRRWVVEGEGRKRSVGSWEQMEGEVVFDCDIVNWMIGRKTTAAEVFWTAQYSWPCVCACVESLYRTTCTSAKLSSMSSSTYTVSIKSDHICAIAESCNYTEVYHMESVS